MEISEGAGHEGLMLGRTDGLTSDRMTRSRDRAARMWRCVPLALILCWRAPAAFAEVPDATIQRIAELNVQEAETRYLSNSQQISDSTYYRRMAAINAEQRTLWQSF